MTLGTSLALQQLSQHSLVEKLTFTQNTMPEDPSRRPRTLVLHHRGRLDTERIQCRAACGLLHRKTSCTGPCEELDGRPVRRVQVSPGLGRPCQGALLQGPEAVHVRSCHVSHVSFSPAELLRS